MVRGFRTLNLMSPKGVNGREIQAARISTLLRLLPDAHRVPDVDGLVRDAMDITQDEVNQFGDGGGPANADIDDGDADMDARVTRPTEAPPAGVVTAGALVDRITGSLFHC